jgi:hypothetical protein
VDAASGPGGCGESSGSAQESADDQWEAGTRANRGKSRNRLHAQRSRQKKKEATSQLLWSIQAIQAESVALLNQLTERLGPAHPKILEFLQQRRYQSLTVPLVEPDFHAMALEDLKQAYSNAPKILVPARLRGRPRKIETEGAAAARLPSEIPIAALTEKPRAAAHPPAVALAAPLPPVEKPGVVTNPRSAGTAAISKARIGQKPKEAAVMASIQTRKNAALCARPLPPHLDGDGSAVADLLLLLGQG